MLYPPLPHALIPLISPILSLFTKTSSSLTCSLSLSLSHAHSLSLSLSPPPAVFVYSPLGVPPTLPAGWESKLTADGLIFYVDHNTKVPY